MTVERKDLSPMAKTMQLERTFSWIRFPFMIFLIGIPAVLILTLLFVLGFIFWLLDYSGVVMTIGFLSFFLFVAWMWLAFRLAFLPTITMQQDRTKQALGARDISSREKDIVVSALQRFQDLGRTDLNVHANFWVLDYPLPKAWTIGEDLYITSSAIADEHLLAILAHEIAHLNQGDGNTVKTLRNFVYSFVSYRITGIGNLMGDEDVPSRDAAEAVQLLDGSVMRLIFAAVFGGFGVIWYRDEWAQYFREQDLSADRSVAGWGLEGDLLAYLEANKELSLASPYSLNWDCWTELRIDGLLSHSPHEQILSLETPEIK